MRLHIFIIRKCWPTTVHNTLETAAPRYNSLAISCQRVQTSYVFLMKSLDKNKRIVILLKYKNKTQLFSIPVISIFSLLKMHLFFISFAVVCQEIY